MIVVDCRSKVVIDVEGSMLVMVGETFRVEIVVLGKTIELILVEVVPN